MKSAILMPNMDRKDIKKLVSFLIGNDKKCSKCGNVNSMIEHMCRDCALKASECTECGKTCHADLGGIYGKCKTCLVKENALNHNGSENSQECN